MFKQTSLGAQGCAGRAALCCLLLAHMHFPAHVHAQSPPACLPCMQCPGAGDGTPSPGEHWNATSEGYSAQAAPKIPGVHCVRAQQQGIICLVDMYCFGCDLTTGEHGLDTLAAC